MVLSALYHLSKAMMQVSENDPAYLLKFREKKKEKNNVKWLKVATALDLKDLKSLNKADKAEVWL